MIPLDRCWFCKVKFTYKAIGGSLYVGDWPERGDWEEYLYSQCISPKCKFYYYIEHKDDKLLHYQFKTGKYLVKNYFKRGKERSVVRIYSNQGLLDVPRIFNIEDQSISEIESAIDNILLMS